MKNTLRIGMGLIAVSLVALIVSSAHMVNYVQYDVRSLSDQHLLKFPFICEQSIREGGFSRIALGSLGLLILAIPFRRRELWAWISLAIIFLHHLRVFVLLPETYRLPTWYDVKELALQPGLRILLFNLLFPALLLIGLAISLPSFLRSGRSSSDPSPD
jgi:hypothetical protein